MVQAPTPIDLGIAPGGTLVTTATAQTVHGPDIVNIWGTSAKFFVNVSAASGTNPTTLVTIEGKDPVSGTYYTILASTALAAVASQLLAVGPGITVAANKSVADWMPPVFRISVTYGGTTPTVAGTIGMSFSP